jgi:hypothetical protein
MTAPRPTTAGRAQGTGRPRQAATGVYHDLRKGLFRVRLWHAGKFHSGGYFPRFDAAVAARDKLLKQWAEGPTVAPLSAPPPTPKPNPKPIIFPGPEFRPTDGCAPHPPRKATMSARRYVLPDRLPGERNEAWLRRAAATVPADALMRIVVAHLIERQGEAGAARFVADATAHGAGMSWALVERFRDRDGDGEGASNG